MRISPGMFGANLPPSPGGYVVYAYGDGTDLDGLDNTTQYVVTPDDGEGPISRTIVDPQGVIRFVYVTDLNVGRSPEEVLRVLDALQTDELCPCNWQKGEQTLKAA